MGVMPRFDILNGIHKERRRQFLDLWSIRLIQSLLPGRRQTRLQHGQRTLWPRHSCFPFNLTRHFMQWNVMASPRKMGGWQSPPHALGPTAGPASRLQEAGLTQLGVKVIDLLAHRLAEGLENRGV